MRASDNEGKLNVFFIRFSISALCCILMAVTVSGQLSNGTQVSQEYIDMLRANKNAEAMVVVDTLNPQLSVKLTINVFIVISEDGNDHFDQGMLDNGLAQANQYFSKIGISFVQGATAYVNEYPYGIIKAPEATEEMEVKYAHPEYIDLFLVDSIGWDFLSIYGFSSPPEDTLRSSLILLKSATSGKYLTTLLGSFFGLLMTHETFAGAETVDQAFCDSVGDLICDTWADPGLLQLVDAQCLYFGSARDANGEYYIPTVTNIMSDSEDMCKCRFTIQQYRRMKFIYNRYRNYLR